MNRTFIAYIKTSFQDYGGHDIMLIETKHHMRDIQPICIPSKNYKDYGVHATIAGYGKFQRPVCEVDSRGPSKYKSCGVEPDCRRGTEKYNQNDCSVQFRYKVCFVAFH